MAGLVDFKNEEEVKQYLENIEIEFTFGCEKEGISDSCARLANFKESIQKKFEDAEKIYSSCCETYRNPICCFKIGQYHVLGRGGLEKNYVKAFKNFRTGCIQVKTSDEGKNGRIGASCCNMGLLMFQHCDKQEEFSKVAKENYDNSKADNKVELIGKDEPKTALDALTRACELNDPPGCNFLSQLYMTGMHNLCSIDWNLAAKYAEKACDLNESAACHNLATMYSKGDGVAKDKEKALKYTNKKEEILHGSFSLEFGRQ